MRTISAVVSCCVSVGLLLSATPALAAAGSWTAINMYGGAADGLPISFGYLNMISTTNPTGNLRIYGTQDFNPTCGSSGTQSNGHVYEYTGSGWNDWSAGWPNHSGSGHCGLDLFSMTDNDTDVWLIDSSNNIWDCTNSSTSTVCTQKSGAGWSIAGASASTGFGNHPLYVVGTTACGSNYCIYQWSCGFFSCSWSNTNWGGQQVTVDVYGLSQGTPYWVKADGTIWYSNAGTATHFTCGGNDVPGGAARSSSRTATSGRSGRTSARSPITSTRSSVSRPGPTK